jgi:L-threonylcarbamoyladenylate synthase
LNKNINNIVEALKNGAVVLIATDTVYGLAVLPTIENAVAKIYELKKRPRNMFLPIMVAKISDLEILGLEINDNVKKMFNSKYVPGAITFVLGFKTGREKPEWLKNRDEIAVRIPNDEVLLSVLEKTGALLVTSANLHGISQTPTNVKDILAQLNGKPDLIIENGEGKEIPSTIINFRENPPKIERLGAISKEEIEEIFKEN